MKNLALILMAALFVTSCQTTPKLTAHQRRALQVRTFDHDLNTVFKAFKTILLDEGYIIKNQDMNGGMILAQKETDAMSGGMKFLNVFSGSNNYVTGRGYEVSVNFDNIGKNTTETRLTLQTTTKTNIGGSSGKEIVQPQIYKSLYDKVTVEVGRRKARGL